MAKLSSGRKIKSQKIPETVMNFKQGSVYIYRERSLGIVAFMLKAHPLYCSLASADRSFNPGFMLFPDFFTLFDDLIANKKILLCIDSLLLLLFQFFFQIIKLKWRNVENINQWVHKSKRCGYKLRLGGSETVRD